MHLLELCEFRLKAGLCLQLDALDRFLLASLFAVCEELKHSRVCSGVTTAKPIFATPVQYSLLGFWLPLARPAAPSPAFASAICVVGVQLHSWAVIWNDLERLQKNE